MTLPRLLVVDDDPDVCEMVRITLAARYEVATETDGRRALERFAAFDPEVVVLDLVMPGADGLTVCERIKAARPDILVVIITATTKGSDLPDAVWRLGTRADEFISKPFDPELLAAKIQGLHARRDARAPQADHPEVP